MIIDMILIMMMMKEIIIMMMIDMTNVVNILKLVGMTSCLIGDDYHADNDDDYDNGHHLNDDYIT